MNQNEIVSIVDLVAAADGRNVSEQTYGAWFLVLGHLGIGLAREGALEALKDESIRWVEPKHILGKVSKILDRQELAKRKERALSGDVEKQGAPVPICIDHNLSIMQCDPCCAKALQLSKDMDGVNGHMYQTAFYGSICHPQ